MERLAKNTEPISVDARVDDCNIYTQSSFKCEGAEVLFPVLTGYVHKEKNSASKNRRHKTYSNQGKRHQQRQHHNHDTVTEHHDDKSKKRKRRDSNQNQVQYQENPRVLPICTFYLQNKCNKKDECPFRHEGKPAVSTEICKFYVSNCCKNGSECFFSHDLKSMPCKYFHIRGFCNDNDGCRFSHDPISQEEKIVLKKQIFGDKFIDPNNPTGPSQSTEATTTNVGDESDTIVASDTPALDSTATSTVLFNPFQSAVLSLSDTFELSAAPKRAKLSDSNEDASSIATTTDSTNQPNAATNKVSTPKVNTEYTPTFGTLDVFKTQR